jgi:hypothetical protein
MGSLIQDPVDGNGIGILDSGTQVALAGHRHDDAGPLVHQHLSGQGTSGGDGDVYVILLRHLYDIPDQAISASPAIIIIGDDLMRAVEILQTVRQKNQQAVFFYSFSGGLEKRVINLNEGLPYLILGKPKQLPQKKVYGKQHL